VEGNINDLKADININLIKESKIKILYDAMYGSGQGMMDGLLNLTSIHSEINPSFGGTHPEPVSDNLKEISEILSEKKYDIGIATDGDADRIALLDENGNFIDAQKTFALLLLYLVEDKKMSGVV
jgi:phosphomannomutase